MEPHKVVWVLPPCLVLSAPIWREEQGIPRVVMSVGPVYQLCSNGSLFSMILIPSIAANGIYVVLEAANPADTKNGFRASTISSYRSCDQLT